MIHRILSFIKIHPTMSIVAAITLFGAGLRLYHLGFKSLWLDEAVLYWITQNNLKTIILQNSITNSAPPLYALIVGMISKINNSEAALRMFSCMAGIAAIPAMFLLSRRFLSKNLSFLTSILVAIAPNQIKYSQELREYSLSFYLSILLMLYFHRFISKPNKKDLIWLSVITFIGFLTQYGLALLLMAFYVVFVWEIFINKNKKLIQPWLIYQAVALFSILVVYAVSLNSQFKAGGFGGSGYLSSSYLAFNGLGSMINFLGKNFFNLINFSFTGSYLTLLLILFGVVANFKNKKNLAILLLPIGVTAVAGILRLYPFDGVRQTIFLNPMIYILIVSGIGYLGTVPNIKYVLIGLLMILGMIDSNNYLKSTGPENMRAITANIKKQWQNGDKIYVYYGSVPAFKYYWTGESRVWEAKNSGRNNNKIYLGYLNKELPKNKRSWIVLSHCFKTECEEINKALGAKNMINSNDSQLWLKSR